MKAVVIGESSGASMEQVIDDSIGPQKLYAWLLGLFAAIGAGLASAGVYGVMSYVVTLRTRELGVRLALGATGGRVMASILGRGAVLAGLGLTLGLGGALALTRVLQGALFGVTPTDPPTFIAIAVLMSAIAMLKPQAVVTTPSYAAYLAERDFDRSSVERVLVAGEPGGGEPAFRAQLEEGWGARVTEAMGVGDIGVTLWGECEHQTGMHLGARGFVHPELIDPDTAEAIPMEDGATGELVLTHLRHRAAPLLRFRTRDHVRVSMRPCPCGRTGPRIRCIGRTDDMLIVRGVNVFPSAVREVVGEFAPRISGNVLVRPQAPGPKQDPPLPISVELAREAPADPGLAEAIGGRLREVLVVRARVDLVPFGSLPRSEYKSTLVRRS